MKFKEYDFLPLLFGGDINSYSMARAFHEEYKVKCVMYGKYNTGPNCNSKIVDYRVNPRSEDLDFMLETVNKYAEENNDKKILLIGCGDSYVKNVITLKDKFPENVITPYIDLELYNKLSLKADFYNLCKEYDLDYPSTFIYSADMGDNLNHGFEYPVIMKASNSVAYWEHKFEGQRKVYKIKTEKQLRSVVKEIYEAGYPDKLIIQDFVPGDDTQLYAFIGYCGKDKKTKLMAFSHVLRQEHTIRGLGNDAVSISRYNKELADKAAKFLNGLGYTGFFDLDLKYDTRDRKFKFFEINIRQGRSHYHVTGSGYNLAKYVVQDYIYDKDMEYTVANSEVLFTVIPLILAVLFINPWENKKSILKLILKGKVVNPTFYIKDMGVVRFLRFLKTHLSHFAKMHLE